MPDLSPEQSVSCPENLKAEAVEKAVDAANHETREARADRLTEEARNVNGEAEAEVWALRVLFEEMHFEKFGTYPDYDASHEQVKACLAAWTVSKHGRRETPAPSQTEGGGPDDTKQVSKEQGASPSVPPAVTTSQGPVTNTGEDEDLIFIRRELPRVSLELKETRAELDALKARIKREAKLLAQFADSYANPEGDWEAGKRSGLENGASRMFRLLSPAPEGENK